ncbi:MAG: ATP phosphoribosyltransferase [Erysipelotrichaceae bacterium]|nr:ATP phosphoribosyltransferase [Erysipelotrichaceae bacterium]
MKISDGLLSYSEKIIFSLKDLYAQNGYRLYKMSKFEEYDLYAQNKDFLVSDQVLTFTDTNGRLMALKPDVTLSIVKNHKAGKEELTKLYYNENVYRSDRGSGFFKEILQTGIECFGQLKEDDLLGVIQLALASLETISGNFLLTLSDLDLSEALIGSCAVSPTQRKQLFDILKEKKAHELPSFFKENSLAENKIPLMEKLIACNGKLPEVQKDLEELYEETQIDPSLLKILPLLKEKGYEDKIVIDTSLTDDINYYNGIIFKGWLPSVADPILSGGQYDRLMEKLNKASEAIGFAVYTGLLEEEPDKENDGWLNIALPKGRLGENVYRRFADAGYDCPGVLAENRKLVFEDAQKKIRYFWVKPSDVTVYVERGSADLGVAGKDILAEYGPDVYELLDLRTGLCKMAVAAPNETKDDPYKTLKVATKFPAIARAYYRSIGRQIDIIRLNGSIEIAPILGLSDVIVDIVETGKTLKENGLSVKEEIMEISARLIANRSSYAFKHPQIAKLLEALNKKEGQI